MDHLPLAHNPSPDLPTLTFPLRCDPNSYDGGPLESFPERRGFRLNYWGELNFANILSLSDGSRPDIEQSTKLLQEWLFFGLLAAAHSIYGTKFDGYEYVAVKDNVKVLSLEKFPQDAKIWFDSEGDKPKSERKSRFHELERHQMRAMRFLTNNFTAVTFGSLSHTGEKDNVVSDQTRIVVESNLEILLSALLEALEFTVKTAYFRERKNWGASGSYGVCLSTRQSIDNLNWCPSALSFMELTFDNASFCFSRSVFGQYAQNQHIQCTSSKCHAFDMEVSTYQTAHTRSCDGHCVDIHVGSIELEHALTKDEHMKIPRIRISVMENDTVSISLTNDGDYVAISHVWSDGLGHPQGVNALPTCQIRRLHQLVLETGLGDATVWIDALCIPADYGPGKRIALARMADVYRNARNVLVLDSDLLSVPSISCNEELLLRIAICKWMRRLWTLEEGTVARSKLLFQFSDKCIALPQPNRSMTDNIAFNCAELVSQYLPTSTDILSVITALHFRTTSWRADEPLCIGYIVDIDVSTIIDMSDVRLRMLELYRLLTNKDPKFPWQFLFTDEEKLNISPFRWAPASLLNLEPNDVFYLQGRNDAGDTGIEAVQTDRGLRFKCDHSCLLSFDEGAKIKNCMILRIDALSYVLCPVPIGGKCRSHARFWEGADKEECLDADPTRDWTESWKPQYGFRPTGNWGLICSKRGGGYGVMVSIQDFNKKELYGTLIGQVHMYELRTEFSSIVSANKEIWGQVGFPMRDEEKVREEQDRVEREVFDDQHYSFVNCVTRIPDAITWYVG